MEIRRNSLFLALTIDGEENKEGSAFRKEVLDPANRKALVETLILSGLLPQRYAARQIRVFDNLDAEEKNVEIKVEFTDIQPANREERLRMVSEPSDLDLSLIVPAEVLSTSLRNIKTMVEREADSPIDITHEIVNMYYSN
ncbi:hypothetical protein [Butyrivibrio proteoclasticus]|uniref:hypothetical protein n=1 Tax=Butyrivibrio proteoclasticus TaxID=43305 RepID=UPI00047AB39E|nr:hypothetical protein [Butyrivibrio proteoclasticus]